MTSPQPIPATFDDQGRLLIADAARLRDDLGHDPQAGEAVEVTVRPAVRRKFKPSYGVLARLEPTLGKVDIAEVRREMTEELRQAGKI